MDDASGKKSTEIGFYHLLATPLERALPKLLEKVLERGHRVLLLAASEERVQALDNILWTYEDRSWLPHGTAQTGHAERQPIFLSTLEENPNTADVLVLIDGIAPAFATEFCRVIDMFDGRDDSAVAAARERWKSYRDAGLTLTYWQQTETGGWEKKA